MALRLDEGGWLWIGLAVSLGGLAGFALGLLWDWLSGRGLEAEAMGPLQLAVVIGGAAACGVGVAMLLAPGRKAWREKEAKGEEE